jgi:UDP-N-acetylmuramoyl-tripeptide--D-alanyl-D-alanine ligase
LKALRPGGTAVLNADSSWVAAMAPRCERKVVWFGGSAESNLWADEISSCWPERLRFRLHAGSSSWRVKTQLVGTHWTTSLLGAMAVAQVCGLPPVEALAAVENLQPTTARMQPVSLVNRVTILRDEYNGSIDTLGVALRTLADAKASRKVLVITDVGETNQRSISRMRLLAKEAVRVADLTVFVGPDSRHALRAALNAGIPTEAVKSFLSLEETVEYLRFALQPGDLVLLRGRPSDHLSRVYFALTGNIDCWIPKCSLMFLCDYCSKLGARPR